MGDGGVSKKDKQRLSIKIKIKTARDRRRASIVITEQ